MMTSKCVVIYRHHLNLLLQHKITTGQVLDGPPDRSSPLHERHFDRILPIFVELSGRNENKQFDNHNRT